MMRNEEMQYRYSIERIPAEIADNLKEFTEHDDDISCEEFLMQQESVYQSIQESGDWSQFEGESSSAISQLGSDEALARALQELEDAFDDDLDLPEHSGGSTEISPTETPARATTEEDDVDPDNMSYEQLQSLGDTIGTENSGLSDERISRFPTFKYNNKVGLFSKKKKIEIDQCVICITEFDNGERLMRLPCRHKYHPQCITIWLKDKKKCPICQEELS